jgi:hypothetical protein
MKKNVIIPNTSFKVLFLLLVLIITCSYVLKNHQDAEDYYVYHDSWINHGIPTGFMGEKDGKSLKLDDAWKENPYKGEKCIKMSVDNSESWRGIHIQYTGAWNVSVEPTTPLADLSAYDKLEFYARADVSGSDFYIIKEIGVGGGGGFEDSKMESFLEVGPQWQKYTINLKNMDLKRVNTMLYMTLNVGTLYLDEIKFVKSKKKK